MPARSKKPKNQQSGLMKKAFKAHTRRLSGKRSAQLSTRLFIGLLTVLLTIPLWSTPLSYAESDEIDSSSEDSTEEGPGATSPDDLLDEDFARDEDSTSEESSASPADDEGSGEIDWDGSPGSPSPGSSGAGSSGEDEWTEGPDMSDILEDPAHTAEEIEAARAADETARAADEWSDANCNDDICRQAAANCNTETGSNFDTCVSDGIRDLGPAEEARAREEAAASSDPHSGVGQTGGPAEPTIVDLGAGLNDSQSFDIRSILTAEGQEHTYLNDPEGRPLLRFIVDIVNIITQVIGAIAIIIIVLGGLLMIVSEGEENRLQRGKEMVISAIIGLVIAMFSFIIVKFFQSIFY